MLVGKSAALTAHRKACDLATKKLHKALSKVAAGEKRARDLEDKLATLEGSPAKQAKMEASKSSGCRFREV